MDEHHVIDRLRALGAADLDPGTTHAHLAAAATVRTRTSRFGRAALVATCAALLATPVAAAVIAGHGSAPERDERPLAPAATAAELDDDLDGDVDAAEDRPECAGPPPFAGVSAGPADPANDVVPSPRAAEAKAWAEQRRACRAAQGQGVDPGEVRDSGGPPSEIPAGPPEGTPSGPPEGTPSGPPEGTPSGPPEGTPTPPVGDPPAGPGGEGPGPDIPGPADDGAGPGPDGIGPGTAPGGGPSGAG